MFNIIPKDCGKRPGLIKEVYYEFKCFFKMTKWMFNVGSFSPQKLWRISWTRDETNHEQYERTDNFHQTRSSFRTRVSLLMLTALYFLCFYITLNSDMVQVSS